MLENREHAFNMFASNVWACAMKLHLYLYYLLKFKACIPTNYELFSIILFIFYLQILYKRCFSHRYVVLL